jgi:hypothetical protein
MKTTKLELRQWQNSGKRVRTVQALEIFKRTIRAASLSGYDANVENGGSVPNCYNYPASSECFGAVAVRKHGRGGVAYGHYAAIPANKITDSGAAAATLGFRAPWDCRMNNSSAQADHSKMKEICWQHGDVQWRETALGGLYYRVPGSKWADASQQLKPDTSPSFPPIYAARVLRRMCPDGWVVVVTPASQGAKPSLAYRETATGEEYHAPMSGKTYTIYGFVAAAREAFNARRNKKDELMLAELLESGRADTTLVCARDSVRAGNCRAGTESFAARHGLDLRRHYTAGELRLMANGDARFVRAAVIMAMRRERIEIQRGKCLITEHIA